MIHLIHGWHGVTARLFPDLPQTASKAKSIFFSARMTR